MSFNPLCMLSSGPPANRLQSLVRAPATGIGEIEAFLRPMAFGARWAQLAVLTRADQRTLYEKAAAAAPLTLQDFVPDRVPARTEVVHRGRNTLPLPEPLSFFEKRFCRPEHGAGRLFGYNEGLTRPLVGPGYFVLVPTAGNAEWERRGAIVIDYFQVPDGAVVHDWPAVVPNHKGVQRLVYYHTRDFMRRVAPGVTVGAAYKEEKALDHYFVLCGEGL